MEKIFKQNIFSWLIIIVSLPFALLKADVLPDTIPRFDLWGREYAFVNKPTSLTLNPVLAAASIIVLSVLFGSPRERPTQKVNDFAFKMIRSMSFTNLIITVSLMGNYMLGLRRAIGPMTFWEYVIPVGINLVNIAIGFFLRNVVPNAFFGYRLSWIVESPDIHKKTHKFGAKLHSATGSILLVPMILEPNPFVSVFGIFFAVLGALIFAYRLKMKSVQ